jgi:UDP:flavonoid glycosyltransferase YjiC (YdhE family)
MSSQRPTILFIAEAVTLAHLARPAALAEGLDPLAYDVVLACDRRYQHFLDRMPFRTRHIRSIPSDQFLKAVAVGRPIFDRATLHDYVREDIALLEEVRPAAVIGDLRLSLSVSARVAGIPYLPITTAYWSPHAEAASPLPELPMNRWLGTRLAQWLFRLTKPTAFAYHALPLNRVRRDYGLAPLPLDLRYTYTDGDHTLYADARELVPIEHLPAKHHYLGPILWSPPVALPPWWDELPSDRPLIYATLGSSGDPGLLKLTLDALADLPVTVVATTAAKADLGTMPANAHVLAYAPGDKLAARADLMICNGGSLTVYQSLAAGKPLIGIASHMDQHLSMLYVEKAGAGRLLRSEQLSATKLRTAVEQMLEDAQTKARAQALARAIGRYHPAERLAGILQQVI